MDLIVFFLVVLFELLNGRRRSGRLGRSFSSFGNSRSLGLSRFVDSVRVGSRVLVDGDSLEAFKFGDSLGVDLLVNLVTLIIRDNHVGSLNDVVLLNSRGKGGVGNIDGNSVNEVADLSHVLEVIAGIISNDGINSRVNETFSFSRFGVKEEESRELVNMSLIELVSLGRAGSLDQ